MRVKVVVRDAFAPVPWIGVAVGDTPAHMTEKPCVHFGIRADHGLVTPVLSGVIRVFDPHVETARRAASEKESAPRPKGAVRGRPIHPPADATPSRPADIPREAALLANFDRDEHKSNRPRLPPPSAGAPSPRPRAHVDDSLDEHVRDSVATRSVTQHKERIILTRLVNQYGTRTSDDVLFVIVGRDPTGIFVPPTYSREPHLGLAIGVYQSLDKATDALRNADERTRRAGPGRYFVEPGAVPKFFGANMVLIAGGRMWPLNAPFGMLPVDAVRDAFAIVRERATDEARPPVLNTYTTGPCRFTRGKAVTDLFESHMWDILEEIA